ncbi:phosphosulfolactate synthase [Cohnella endophytica]|uniref:Phosphosulfolactate synthase n=1 Tax=Cohnella endophytica TaxID=2419778 RepID=A0A494Y3E7_9BACL|nr:phosphosulfolactate synthase [Cohnella endophytica]RKP57179.1 phosphosulfolactate synthase [Cohnella endophytica]
MSLMTSKTKWPEGLSDPSGRRQSKPRTEGRTMIIDKGIGVQAFEDMLETSGEYIDIIKFGFGTSPLYPLKVLRRKIELANRHGITVIPGGTLLEVAVRLDLIPGFFRQVLELGYSGIEVSDGTISISRTTRSDLIRDAKSLGLTVFTEYGKKLFGSRIDIGDFAETAEQDWACGADLVTVEARESGKGVGLFDEQGECRDGELSRILSAVPNLDRVVWEAPLKEQQVYLIRSLGPNVHLGNIPVQDVLTLETMRRGLRSDTFELQQVPCYDYMI